MEVYDTNLFNYKSFFSISMHLEKVEESITKRENRFLKLKTAYLFEIC